MLQIPHYGYFVGFCRQFLLHATVGMPDQALWVTAGVLLILAAVSMVDAFTEIVPDAILALGLIALIGMQGFYVSWSFAAHHLMMACVAGIFVWTMNEAFFRIFGEDIFRAGDAKWTVLAVACFDVEPVLCAWGFALSLGVLKVICMRIVNRPVTNLYLAPFLFPGLVGALYVLRVSTHGVKFSF